MWNRIKNAAAAFRMSPNISIADLDKLIDGFEFGAETTSGVRVTEQSGTRQATVYSCINILSRDMSAQPLKIYERKADGGRVEVKSHPVSEWLRAPNQSQTSMQWRMRGWYSALATGNQFDQVLFARDGSISTVPLDASRMRVMIGDGLSKRYEYTKRDGSKVILRADEVFHNYGLSIDGFVGISPIRHMMETIGRALAVEEFGAAGFRSPVPKMILTHPTGFKSESDRKAFTDEWSSRFAGKKGLASVAVLPQGMEVNQVARIPNNEAQFIETQKLSKEQLAQIYLVPMHRLNALDRATFSNIEHQGLEYVQYSLLPWMTSQEQAIERQFLPPEERNRLFVRHTVDALLRGDFKTRMEGSATAIQWSMATPNERRALENLPAIEGGDDLLVPMNMMRLRDVQAPEDPAEPAPEDDPDEDEPDDEDDARAIALNLRAGLGMPELRAAKMRRRTVLRMAPKLERRLLAEIRQESAAIKANIGTLLRENRDITEFWQWLTEFYADRSSDIRAQAAPVFSELGAQIAKEAEAESGAEPNESSVQAFVSRHSTQFAAVWAAASVEDLRNAAAKAGEDDASESVLRRLEEWEKGGVAASRAETIAKHEVFMLGNAIARLVFTGAGFALVWATFGENCPYCEDMAGKRVAGGEEFAPAGGFQPNGAERPLPIKRGVRQPPLHNGCDCMVVPG